MATIKTSTIYFGKNDDDILEYVDNISEKFSSYVRRLIRSDMEKNKNKKSKTAANNLLNEDDEIKEIKEKIASLDTLVSNLIKDSTIEDKLTKMLDDRLSKLAIGNNIPADVLCTSAMGGEVVEDSTKIDIKDKQATTAIVHGSVKETTDPSTVHETAMLNQIVHDSQVTLNKPNQEVTESVQTNTVNYFTHFEKQSIVETTDIPISLESTQADIKNLISDQL